MTSTMPVNMIVLTIADSIGAMMLIQSSQSLESVELK